MKPIYISVFILLATISSIAQTHYIHTNGRNILGPCGDSLLLRGLNYAPYNWGWDINSLEVDQIAKTGANVVRLDWYWNNPNSGTDAVYKNYVTLDSAISKCVQNKMIAVIEIHDYTCSTDTTGLLNLNTWWTQANIFTNILQKYRESVIVNYANEALYFDFASNPTAALATYKSTYQQIINALRNVNGFNFPIMIDAPDCGTNSDAFITSNLANDLIQFDPSHNLIFSTHTYWYAFANNDSVQMAAKINAVLAQNIPFVLGEVANLQDDVTLCEYVLNYKPLLNYCQQKRVNWLAWSWDNDVCAERQISSTGNFINLTPFGNDIVNNPGYGLLTISAPKSEYLLNGCNTGINNLTAGNELVLFPNPATTSISIKASTNFMNADYFIINQTGETILAGKLVKEITVVNLNKLTSGIYLLRVGEKNQQLFEVIR